MPRHPYVLLATLGGQPQIVTFTLDLLLGRGYPINEVIVIHPEPRDFRLRNSLHHLKEEFTSDYYKGAIMHMPANVGIKLIRGPFISLGAYIYAPQLSFHAAHSDQRSRIDAQEEAKCAQVVKEATPAQLKVLKAFSRGLKTQQIATELQIEVVTVHSHKTALLRLCHTAWNIDASEYLNYHFLQTKFAGYFDKRKPDEFD